jgi:flagellar basal body rod protein FlgG
MKTKKFIITELIIVILIISVLLSISLPRFLDAQRHLSHHPEYKKGTLVKTDDPFDVAINGKGYFRLTRDDGMEVYARHSELHLDNTGRLTSIHGFPLADNIVLPQNHIKVDISIMGIVTVIQNPGFQDANVGQIQLAAFINPDGLVMDENGCYLETEESGPPVLGNPSQNELGMLLQGYHLKQNFDTNTPEHLIINGEFYNGYDDLNQEPLIKTDRAMDLAIDGPGWAAVTLPDGLNGYTRRLSVSRDETGQFVIEYGRGQANLWGIPINLREDEEYQKRKSDLKTQLSHRSSRYSEPTNSVAVENIPIEADVEIHKKLNELDHEYDRKQIMNPPSPEELATKIQLYRFASPEMLHYMHKGIYVETDASGPAIPIELDSKNVGAIKSGYLNDVPRSEP